MNLELFDIISHKEVQHKKGKWQIGDRGLWHGFLCMAIAPEDRSEYVRVMRISDGATDEVDLRKQGELLWLPLSIDPINPERGVWNWIDWWRKIQVVGISPTEIALRVFRDPHYSVLYEGDPLIVLLKVFLYQQGQEVKDGQD
jgi:hypothetical protein